MIKKKHELYKWLAVPTALLMTLLLFSHTYNDIVITTRHGINLWDILFQGKFLDFFAENVTVSGNAYFTELQSCAYNILVYLVFAIWNLPLYLLETFGGVDVMNSILCLTYSKLMVVAAMLYSAYLLDQIIAGFGVSRDRRHFLTFLYLSSTAMISITLITSQYDVLSVIFQLLGLKAYLERKDKPFVVWFGIATCFKLFSLLIFLPLLVLRHKKLLVWIKYCLLVCIPYLFTTLLFAFGRSSGGNLALTLLIRVFGQPAGGIHLFVPVYICIVVWSYFHNSNDSIQKMQRNAVWVCFASFAAFACLLDIHPYWTVLLLPFVTMAMALMPGYDYPNLLLETAGLAAFTFGSMIKFDWHFFGHTMKSMAMKLVFGQVHHASGLIYTAISELKLEGCVAVIHSVFVAAMGIMLFLLYPRKTPLELPQWKQPGSYDEILVVRFLATAVICLIPLLSLFI